MNRRNLLKSIVGIAGMSSIGAAMSSGSGRKIGFLDVMGHRAHRLVTGDNLRTFLDGIEVHNVFEADDIEGYVRLFCTDQVEHKNWNAKGAKHIAKGGGACRLEVRGRVEFRV